MFSAKQCKKDHFVWHTVFCGAALARDISRMFHGVLMKSGEREASIQAEIENEQIIKQWVVKTLKPDNLQNATLHICLQVTVFVGQNCPQTTATSCYVILCQPQSCNGNRCMVRKLHFGNPFIRISEMMIDIQTHALKDGISTAHNPKHNSQQNLNFYILVLFDMSL